ncbi:MAG: 3-hydroxyacyl-ACP dehydratase, partial [Deltaproteobacteria bacterium HGW-Deltaproteobacteria-19]
MRVLGLDIGSRSVDAVWVEDGRIVDWAVADSGFDPGSAAAVFVDRGAHDAIVSTGYGRHGARERFGGTAVTEITA